MGEKRVIILGLLFVLLVILAVFFFKSSGKEKIKHPPSTPSELESMSTILAETKKISLFFLSDEDPFLHPEEREIVADISIIRQARQTIEELIKGSQGGYISPFPPETRLRGLFVTEEGVAYVDFSKDILEKHLSGSSAEISTVFSTVNSLTYNFKSIKRVFILVEGQERETLGGHISLSLPFLPQYNLIAN